jgi:ankyrin repeat protein
MDSPITESQGVDFVNCVISDDDVMTVSRFLRYCQQGSLQQVLEAIEGGANVNAKDEHGWTPLLTSVANNRDPLVSNALIQAGADVNASNQGWTALMRAVAFGHSPEITDMLIKAGADVHAKNEYGKTALDYAGGNEKIIELLTNAASIGAAEKDGQTGTIKVSNAREFLEALGSDRIIEMAPGEFNLSMWDTVLNNMPEQAPPYPNLRKEGSPKLAPGVSWSDDPFDGGELVLRGIKNLTIDGGAGQGGAASIIIDPRYAFVLKFIDCSEIVIQNLEAGHSEGGYCAGGVFNFVNSQRITITGAGMYGCGTVGLELSNVSDMKVTNSRIYECTDGIMTVYGGKNIAFENCEFTNNQGGLYVQDTTISISNSAFKDNKSYEPIQETQNVEFVNCTFGEGEGAGVTETVPDTEMIDPAFNNLCEIGSLEQIVRAIKDGANVNARGSDNEMTPLMSAAWRGDDNSTLEVITVLISGGADVNARNADGMTPLMWTAHRVFSPEVSKALIEAGADVSARCDFGNTALMWAEMGASSPEIVTVLVNAGLDVNASNNDKYTALMYAAGSNPNTGSAINLIKAGANVNASGNDGQTPLMQAARWTLNPEMITTLLKNGADPKMTDNSGKTAIDYASENENIRNTDVFMEMEQIVSRAETAGALHATPPQEGNGDEKIVGEVRLIDNKTGNTKTLYPPFSEEDKGLLFYHNDRYGYAMMIPDIFTEVVLLPGNEDGLILGSKNGEYRFRASGGFVVFEDELQKAMEAAKKYVEENVDGAIIYEKTGDDWWELNWWNGPEKGVRKFMTNGEAWCECEITSPGKLRNEQGEYDNLFERSLATMSFPVG